MQYTKSYKFTPVLLSILTEQWESAIAGNGLCAVSNTIFLYSYMAIIQNIAENIQKNRADPL